MKHFPPLEVGAIWRAPASAIIRQVVGLLDLAYGVIARPRTLHA